MPYFSIFTGLQNASPDGVSVSPVSANNPLPVTLAAGSAVVGSTYDAGPSQTISFGVSGAVYTSADRSASAAPVTDVPTSGQKLVITDIVMSADTSMCLTFTEETSGTVVEKVYLTANAPVQLTPRGKLKLATANKRLQVQSSVAGNVAIKAYYYSEA